MGTVFVFCLGGAIGCVAAWNFIDQPAWLKKIITKAIAKATGK